MNSIQKAFNHIFTMWCFFLMCLSWIIRYKEIPIAMTILFGISCIYPLIQIIRYHIKKTIDKYGNPIIEDNK